MFHLLVAMAAAQEGPALTWNPNLEVRPRYSFDSFDGQHGEATIRSRLGLGAERGSLSARVVLQDARAWGEDGATVDGRSSGLSLREGWARLAAPNVETVGYAITAGRAPVVLDNGRLLGADDFTLTGRSVDVLRLELIANPFGVEYLNVRQLGLDPAPFSPGMNIFRFHGGRANAATTWATDALFIVDLRDETVLTTGAYGQLDTGRLRTRLEGYAQLAEAPALLVSASAGWVFGSNEGLTVHLRGDLASGEGDGFSSFSAPLGDTYPWFGIADRVHVSDADGCLDTWAVVEARPWPQLRLSVAGHHFYGLVPGESRGLEADVEGRWWPSRYGSVGVGLAATTGEIGPGVRSYLELDVRF